MLVFWFGWPTSEVPGIYFVASLLDALRRGRRGDFTGRRGKAALALTAASWAILGVIRYRGVTTPGPVLEAGLRDQLGPDYADALAALPQSEPNAGGGATFRWAIPWPGGATSRKPTSCPTGRTAGPTWLTSGAAAICRAMARRRYCYRYPAARG